MARALSCQNSETKHLSSLYNHVLTHTCFFNFSDNRYLFFSNFSKIAQSKQSLLQHYVRSCAESTHDDDVIFPIYLQL